MHVESGNTFAGVTDAVGNYQLISIRTGKYRITVELSGFATVPQEVGLLLGQRAVLNFQMQPAALERAITVTGSAPLVALTQSQLGGNIDTRQMRSGAGGYQFVQSRGLVVLIYEFNHIVRIIRLDGQPHIGDNIHLFMGDSRGRWDGDTLVVDTTNFTDKTWCPVVGTFHSDALHVVERFTMVDADLIDYDATFEDSNVFTRPWKLAGWFPRAIQGYEPFEYACAEGNHNLENVIKQPSR